MPADDDIDLLREIHAGHPAPSMDPVEWDTGLTWPELYRGTAYPFLVECLPRYTFCPLSLFRVEAQGQCRGQALFLRRSCISGEARLLLAK